MIHAWIHSIRRCNINLQTLKGFPWSETGGMNLGDQLKRIEMNDKG